ncbi:MAG TPA: ABC transporter ATP-binding protein [Conexibacter sp.]|jgi:ABC-2 type transport system ATP-binding protein|nr:ABC transporter ATP-binding protein [Conexibacter sp.]
MTETALGAAAGAAAVQSPAADELELWPALELCGVRKRWPKAKEPVLAGIELELAPGAVAWIAGSNGAGKTTLLRIVAGLLAPDGGTVRLDGMAPDRERAAYQRAIGLISAGDRGLHARLTVRQDLGYWAGLAMLGRAAGRAAVERAIEAFDLGGLAGHRVDRLSMGQRQRVRIAMAFMHEPRLLLLDEPTTSLDEEGRACLHAAVAERVAAGCAVLWCSPTGERPGVPLDAQYALVGGRLAAA